VSALEDRIRQLTGRFVLALPDRVAAIAASLRAAHAEPESELVRTELRRQLHAMSGTAATYGFPWIAGIACEAEAVCLEPFDARSLDVLEILVRGLEAAAQLEGSR
jgi:chemotaxis protein histidine kinase CheA